MAQMSLTSRVRARKLNQDETNFWKTTCFLNVLKHSEEFFEGQGGGAVGWVTSYMIKLNVVKKNANFKKKEKTGWTCSEYILTSQYTLCWSPLIMNEVNTWLFVPISIMHQRIKERFSSMWPVTPFPKFWNAVSSPDCSLYGRSKRVARLLFLPRLHKRSRRVMKQPER